MPFFLRTYFSLERLEELLWAWSASVASCDTGRRPSAADESRLREPAAVCLGLRLWLAGTAFLDPLVSRFCFGTAGSGSSSSAEVEASGEPGMYESPKRSLYKCGRLGLLPCFS